MFESFDDAFDKTTTRIADGLWLNVKIEWTSWDVMINYFIDIHWVAWRKLGNVGPHYATYL